ncbi:MAG TPA: HDIG domain-containing metalloprotein, partial [Anaerolineales bacterium]
ILFLVFLLSARLIISGHGVLPYVFPLAAYGLTVAVLFGAEPALVSSLSLAILVAYGYPNALDLTLYYALSSFFGVLTLGRGQRILTFFWAGAVIASSGSLVAIAFRLPLPETDWVGITTLVGAALLNGTASASLAVLLQFFLAQLLGMTTALQLLEISRPDHPLLQFALRNAPGTYQHSLQVANLAEQAAEHIGADALLTRVGALYHDVGKALNPAFFIENQMPGNPNPHDQLDPLPSASIITKHIKDSLELARKYRIPRRLQDFMLEHHGTMIARYQYVNAVKAAGGDESKVDPELFRYPGPRPRSRETAILMLADGCEARVRAERPKDTDEMRALIKSVIQNRMSQGQLDDTDLTLRDLDAIAESFTTTLRGVYHPRIEYPNLEKTTPSATEAVPTLPTGAQTAQEANPSPKSNPPTPAPDSSS